jgi:hypothetical protein
VQVDQEDAVHPALGPPAPVGPELGLAIAGDLEQQGHVAGGQLAFDAPDELSEERLDAERAGRAVDHEAERAGPPVGQRAGRAARLPAQLLGDRQDAVAGGLGDARPPVQGERDGALGDAGPPRDVRDRRTFHLAPPGNPLNRFSNPSKE